MFHAHASLLKVAVFSAAVLLQLWQQCEVPIAGVSIPHPHRLLQMCVHAPH